MNNDSAQIIACIPRLRRYARALGGTIEDADDLVQDTLERVWNRLHLWQRERDLRAWMFSIMHNLYIDQYRARPKHTIEAFDHEIHDAPTRGTQADALEVRDLSSALDKLPIDQREVLILVAVEQLNYEQIAQVLNVPVGTVMSRLSRARAKLRTILEGADGGANGGGNIGSHADNVNKACPPTTGLSIVKVVSGKQNATAPSVVSPNMALDNAAARNVTSQNVISNAFGSNCITKVTT